MPEEIIRRKRHLSSFQIIILGFAGVILLGMLLLMLPISTTARNVTPFNEAIYRDLCRLCNGACGTGYRELLVSLRASCHFRANPDRWAWRCDRCGIVCTAVRAKNLSDAAQHHAGCHLSTKSWWDRSADALYPAWDISD